MSRKWLMTGGLLTFMCFRHFSDDRTSLLCFLVILFRGSNQTSLSSYTFQVYFERFYYAFAETTDELFWTKQKVKAFAFAGKRLERLDNREILCVHRPKFLTVSARPGCKMLRRWIRCLYNNVIDRLCVATNQSINYSREQMLRLNTSPLALIPTVY